MEVYGGLHRNRIRWQPRRQRPDIGQQTSDISVSRPPFRGTAEEAQPTMQGGRGACDHESNSRDEPSDIRYLMSSLWKTGLAGSILSEGEAPPWLASSRPP